MLTSKVLVAAGQTVQSDFVAELGPASVVAGRVTYPDGQPVVGADVGLRHSNGQTWDAVTRSDGRYRIKFQAPSSGTLEIGCEDQAFEMPAVPVAPGQIDLLLVIPREVICVVRIVDAFSGQPMTRTSIEWTWSATVAGSTFERGDDTEWTPGPDGSSQVALPVGRLSMTFDATRLGYAQQTISHEVERDHPGELTVRLQREG